MIQNPVRTGSLECAFLFIFRGRGCVFLISSPGDVEKCVVCLQNHLAVTEGRGELLTGEDGPPQILGLLELSAKLIFCDLSLWLPS